MYIDIYRYIKIHIYKYILQKRTLSFFLTLKNNALFFNGFFARFNHFCMPYDIYIYIYIKIYIAKNNVKFFLTLKIKHRSFTFFFLRDSIIFV